MQARNWCFTLNNYTPEEEAKLKEMKCEYMVFGHEVGESGTPHLQGYVEFKGCKRDETLRKFNPRIHWEKRKRTQQQAADYCKKDGVDIFEKGKLVIKKQGQRNDLEEIRSSVKDGSNMRGLLEICTPSNIRFAEKYLTYFERKRNWKPKVTWIYGPTGTGKSFTARKMFEGEDVYRKSTNSKWWCGYDAHEKVIIDDFRDSWWSLTEMLRLLDDYDTQVECKGGNRQFLAKEIIVTSAFHPGECYKGVGENINQLIGRIDTIIHLEGKDHRKKTTEQPNEEKEQNFDVASEVEQDASADSEVKSLQEAFKSAKFLFDNTSDSASEVPGNTRAGTSVTVNELFDNIDSDKFSL